MQDNTIPHGSLLRVCCVFSLNSLTISPLSDHGPLFYSMSRLNHKPFKNDTLILALKRTLIFGVENLLLLNNVFLLIYDVAIHNLNTHKNAMSLNAVKTPSLFWCDNSIILFTSFFFQNDVAIRTRKRPQNAMSLNRWN